MDSLAIVAFVVRELYNENVSVSRTAGGSVFERHVSPRWGQGDTHIGLTAERLQIGSAGFREAELTEGGDNLRARRCERLIGLQALIEDLELVLGRVSHPADH